MILKAIQISKIQKYKFKCHFFNKTVSKLFAYRLYSPGSANSPLFPNTHCVHEENRVIWAMSRVALPRSGLDNCDNRSTGPEQTSFSHLDMSRNEQDCQWMVMPHIGVMFPTTVYSDGSDSRLVPSQWETALLCNDVSHWLGASLESALDERLSVNGDATYRCMFPTPVYS